MNKPSIRGNIYILLEYLDSWLPIEHHHHYHHHHHHHIIIIIIIKATMTVTKSNHFPGYLVSDEGMLTLSASSHHNQSKESSREQGLTSKELREKQKYKTLTWSRRQLLHTRCFQLTIMVWILIWVQMQSYSILQGDSLICPRSSILK